MEVQVEVVQEVHHTQQEQETLPLFHQHKVKTVEMVVLQTEAMVEEAVAVLLLQVQ